MSRLSSEDPLSPFSGEMIRIATHGASRVRLSGQVTSGIAQISQFRVEKCHNSHCRTHCQSIVGIASTNSSFDGAVPSSRNNSFRAPIKWR
jgi:hypothetical protein